MGTLTESEVGQGSQVQAKVMTPDEWLRVVSSIARKPQKPIAERVKCLQMIGQYWGLLGPGGGSRAVRRGVGFEVEDEAQD